MKNTAHRIGKSCVAMLLVLCVVLSLPLSALAAASTPSTPVKAAEGVADVNGDNKITVVSFGDSVTNGYGLQGYRFDDGTNTYGFLRVVEGGYPDLIRDALVAKGHTVDLKQMAVSGYRMDEVHWALDDNYDPDHYHEDHFTDWNINVVEQLFSMAGNDPVAAAFKETYGGQFDGSRAAADRIIQTEYRNAVKNADLITLDLGTNNFGTFMTQAFQNVLMSGGEFVIDLAEYLDPDSAASMEALLNKLIGNLVGAGNSAMADLASLLIKGLIYGYLGFTEHYDGTMEAIYAINPDVKIVVIDMYPMIAGIDMISQKLGDIMDLDGLYKLIIDAANLYTRELSPYATKVTHVTLPEDPELCVDYYADYSGNKAAGRFADSQHLDPAAEVLMNEFVMEMLGYDPDIPASRVQFETEMLAKIQELDKTVNSVQNTVREDVLQKEVEPGIKDGVKLIYDALRVPEAITGYRLINMGVDPSVTGEARKAAIIAALADQVGADMAEIAYAVATAYYTEFENPENAALSELEKDAKGMIAAYATQLGGDLDSAANAYSALQVYEAIYKESGEEKTAAIAALADFLMSSNDQLTKEEAELVAAAMHAIYDGEATAEQYKKASSYALTTKQLKDNADSAARNITQEEAAAIYTCYEGGKNGQYNDETVRTALTVLMVLDGRFDYLDEAKSNYDMYRTYKNLPATLEQIANCKVMYLDQILAASGGNSSAAEMVSGMKDKVLGGTLRLTEPKREDFASDEAYAAAVNEYQYDATMSILFFRFLGQDGVFTHPSLPGQKYMYDCVAKVLDKLYVAEKDSAVTVTENSKLLVLGDFIATDEGYVDTVARNLNLKAENVTNLSNGAFRINELRALLDSSYTGDEYSRTVLAGVTGDYAAAVQENDLIVVHLGSMNMGMITDQLYKYLATAQAYSMNFGSIGNMAVRDLGARVDALLSGFESAFTGEDADLMTGAMMLIFETYGYGYTTFADCLDNTVEAIQKLNPNANIILVGQYDLLGDYNTSSLPGASGANMAFGDFVDHAQKLMNRHMEIYAEMTDNVTYVDVYVNAEDSRNMMQQDAFKRLPTEEGYAEMAGKISCALSAHTPVDGSKVVWGPWTEENTMTAAFECKYCRQAIDGPAFVRVERQTSCDQEGTITYTAFVADVVNPTPKTVKADPTGHTPGEARKEKEVAATCTQAGSYEEVVSCTVCGTELSREKKTVAVVGHKMTEIKGTAATCTAGGIKDHFKCGTCGKLFADKEGKNEVTEASLVLTGGHKLAAVKEVSATCGTNGTKAHFKCETCGKLFADQEGKTEVNAAALVIPGKGGHTPVVVPGKAATCTEKGLSDGSKCSVCGMILKEQKELIAKGHTYKDGKCTECGTVDPNKPNYARIYGANRYETSLAVADALKQTLKIDKFETVIVASGTSFADALAGSCIAAQKNAPILVTNRYNDAMIQEYIQKNLAAKGTVYILGGESAVSADFEKGLAGGAFQIKRLAGEDRYETNLKILMEAGLKAGDEILVCTGKSFADSLSASATGKPILLVRGDHKLFASQKLYLNTLGKENKFIIIGGESAVSAKLEAELKSYGTTERIGGANRFETSTLLAEKFFDKPSAAVLAYAKKFPDGLCGGALAYSVKAPLILTQTGTETQAVSYTNAKGIQAGYVLGGETLISNASADKIFGGK